jgi:hypothetical protein
MAFTKKQEEDIKKAMQQPPPEYYYKDNYLFTIQGCPGYEGYKPKDLSHEVCRYCGTIKYYH